MLAFTCLGLHRLPIPVFLVGYHHWIIEHVLCVCESPLSDMSTQLLNISAGQICFHQALHAYDGFTTSGASEHGGFMPVNHCQAHLQNV